MKAANSTKTSFKKVMADAERVAKEIRTVPAWSWSMNDENLGKFQKLMDAANSEHDDFDAKFMMLEPKVLKELYIETRLTSHLSSFAKKTEYLKVGKCLKTLTKKHAIEISGS